MPGLKQLEKFSNDIYGLGNEESVRTRRGEKMSVVPLPQGISEEDDSDEFLLGLPEAEEEQENEEIGEGIGENDGSENESVDLGIDDDMGDTLDLNSLADEFGSDLLPNDLAENQESGEPASSENLDENILDVDSFANDDVPEEPAETPAADEDAASSAFDMDSIADGFGAGDETSSADSFDMDSLSSDFPSGSETVEDDSDSAKSIADSFSMDAVDEPSGEIPSGEETVSDENNSFDSSGMDFSDMDMNFSDSPSETADLSSSSADDEFPETHIGGDEDDFLLSDNFDIEGYTNTDSDIDKKIDNVDFKGAKENANQRNSISDEEYERFKKNLSAYPLNLKLHIEETISKDGDDAFKDETVFEIIDMVLKKTSAQKLAAYMEKLLDVSIQIPRDFEHRSYEEYEAYKQSFEYQLKNRIVPGAIAVVLFLIVAFGLFKAGKHFVYAPLMASSYYKEGYALLENNEYDESEVKFDKAVEYRPAKKWFFKYARGYREHKQFERAAEMYKKMLGYDKIVKLKGIDTSVHIQGFFENEKSAGLEYANMELYERANYAEAERIVRRFVLDRHVNDPDGELLLGDIFLEWAEEDKSKFDDALEFYSGLEMRYPKNKLYSSRMLRYYIRSDNLREVLVYKPKFYPNIKTLGSEDWTELSGFLLDKLYGELSKSEAYLRSSIEDVLKMLEYAVRTNPSNPVARYNLARYYIHNGYKDRALGEVANALELFGKQKLRTKKDIYKEIDASRILGELYEDNREYTKAQEVFTRGINRYNEEKLRTGLVGDENTGKIFENMGDIDYFITGDIDSALVNYETAIVTKNDTPTINYRIGAIRYGRKEYPKAFASFVKVAESKADDENLLLSLGNVLSLRGDNFAAQSFYMDLMRKLDKRRALLGTLKPKEDVDDGWLVDMYLKVNNNLGVTLFRLAKQTGNSALNAEAMTRFSDAMRAWDSLTRDQQTLIRLEGGNLAAQNAKFAASSSTDLEPTIYTDIPRTMLNEKILK